MSFVPYIGQEALQERIGQMARQLDADYTGRQPLLLGILNGAFIFLADLIRQMHSIPEVSFVKYASYEGTSSTGEGKTLLGLRENIEGRHVVIVEDIVDTGLTITALKKYLEPFRPASVEIAALLLKREALVHPVNLKYIGFEIQNKFVLGYGLDYNGLGRHLPSIFVLQEGKIAH